MLLKYKNAPVAELADAPGLGPGPSGCRFNSCRAHEIDEFKSYMQFPEYCAHGKRDMSFLGRFTFDMMIKQIGLHRVLTTVAHGYMFESETPDIDRAKGALQAWCSLPTEKKDDWKANTNFSEVHTLHENLI